MVKLLDETLKKDASGVIVETPDGGGRLEKKVKA